MKKIFPLLVISILVLSGLGAVAVSDDKHIEDKPMSTEGFELEIGVKGELPGYSIVVRNVGTVPVTGELNMMISTDGFGMIVGKEIGMNKAFDDPIPIEEFAKLKTGLVFGLSPVTIKVSGVFKTGPADYPFETTGNGFVFLFFVICNIDPIHLI